MDTNVLIAIIAGGAATVGAYFSFRTSKQANAVSKRKVDSEAYDRSQQMYERMLNTQDKELNRLQGQVDRLNRELEQTNHALAQEKDVSSTLRHHVNTLQRQVNIMDETITNMRVQLNGDDGRGISRGRRAEFTPPGGDKPQAG